jgi:hypothetical protein
LFTRTPFTRTAFTRTPLRRTITGVALAAAVAGGTTAAIGASASGAPPATARAAAAPAAAAHPAAVAHPAAGATTPSGHALAVQVATWVSHGGESQLGALGKDFGTLENAAKAADMSQMAAGCGQLRTDVVAAQAFAPIPDTTAQKAWSAALTSYNKGALDCVNGATAADGTTLTNAANEIADGSAQLDKVTTRLNQIARQ